MCLRVLCVSWWFVCLSFCECEIRLKFKFHLKSFRSCLVTIFCYRYYLDLLCPSLSVGEGVKTLQLKL
jgi:hypothetical protein